MVHNITNYKIKKVKKHDYSFHQRCVQFIAYLGFFLKLPETPGNSWRCVLASKKHTREFSHVREPPSKTSHIKENPITFYSENSNF